MREQVLIPDEIVYFIADGTAFCTAKIFMCVEICPQVEVEGSVDVLVPIRMQRISRLRLANGLEGSIIEVIGQDIGNLSIDDL